MHIAPGVRADRAKEVQGLWLAQDEGVKFWLRVMNELRNRGVEAVLLAVVGGLKGFGVEAHEPVGVVRRGIGRGAALPGHGAEAERRR